MKRLIVCLIAVCLLCTACASAANTQQAYPDPLGKDTIVAGVRDDVPGFGYLSIERGEIVGYEVDIANAIADALGQQIEFIVVNDETREQALEQGEADMILATFTITDERKERVSFSDPYYQDWLVFLVGDDSAVQSFAGLDGANVGTVKDTTPAAQLEAVAEQESVAVSPVLYDDFSQARQALFAGEVDALFMDESIIRSYSGGRILPDRFVPQEYGIATRKSDTAFLDEINGILSALAADGTLDTFRAHWELGS